MSKQNIEENVESRVCFEQLEDWVRERIQVWVQELLEEEVTELLGRCKSERRRAVDAHPNLDPDTQRYFDPHPRVTRSESSPARH